MRNIKIIIEENGIESYIRAEKITIVSDVMASGKIAILLEDAFHSGGTIPRNNDQIRDPVSVPVRL